MNNYQGLSTVIPAETKQEMKNTPVVRYTSVKAIGISDDGKIMKYTVQVPYLDYKNGLYTRNYSSYNLNFKGFFVRDNNIYSLFQSDSDHTYTITEPLLTRKIIEFEYVREDDHKAVKVNFNEMVWDEISYTDPILKTETKAHSEENIVSGKVRYEQLNSPMYINKGDKQKYSQYFIPLYDGAYQLCTLNGGESYNKEVITPEKAVSNNEQAGFIIVNYLHNNKEVTKRILVKVEVRNCTINCTEN